MQPANAFRPCVQCLTPIARDLLTGDPIELAGEEAPGRPFYRFHRCPAMIGGSRPKRRPEPARNFLRSQPKRRTTFLDDYHCRFRLGGKKVR